MLLQIFPIIKILSLSFAAFVVAFLGTPILTSFLFKYKLGKQIRVSEQTPVFTALHKGKEGTPTMGGILVWGSVVVVGFVVWMLGSVFNIEIFDRLNFFSRPETLLPFTSLIVAAIIGFFDDILGILRIGPNGGGLRMKHRLLLYTAVAIVGALWFFYKLEWDIFHVPFAGDFNIGWWYIPLFIFIIVATAFSTNETDGLDGLAGGILLISYGSFAVIAFAEGKQDLATFCGVIAGALLAFLWFNVYPARFFMGDTGAMSLGVTLGIIAMLTNAALFLPFIAFVMVAESISVIMQITSKKLFKKKIFRSAPIHHHFEAIGWPETKVTMRFWIIGGVMAALGLVLFFIDRFYF
jgi:phospho-N-acetylmuramoyl-pentapeptide-transferase